MLFISIHVHQSFLFIAKYSPWNKVFSPSGKRFRNFPQLRTFLERKYDQTVSAHDEIVLKNLFRIKSDECSVVRVTRGQKKVKSIKMTSSPTFLTPRVIQKKCKLILPKPPPALKETHPLSDSSVTCQKTGEDMTPSSVIFLSPIEKSSLILMQAASVSPVPVINLSPPSEKNFMVEDKCIYTDTFVNTEDLLRIHEKINFEKTETSIVASSNMTYSSDDNVFVDAEMELFSEKVEENDNGEKIVGKLFSEPGDEHFYINNFMYWQDEDPHKDKEAELPEDEARDTEKHVDHNYIGKLTDLDLLDLYYNFDLRISDDILDRFIEITKHLYEDDEKELV